MIEEQKGGQGTHHAGCHEQYRGRAILAAYQHHHANTSHQRHATRQAVHAIEHIEGIDERYSGQNRERPSQHAQVHFAKTEQIAQTRDLVDTTGDQYDGSCQVPHQAHASRQIEAVVHHPETHQHEARYQQHDGMVIQALGSKRRYCNTRENGNAADDRDFAAVLLVAARTVE